LTNNLVSTFKRKPTLLVTIYITGMTLIGAALRLIEIGKQPLWLDEAFSVWMGQHSLSEITRLTIEIDQHPPLYHFLMHGWMALGGKSEAWVRASSALFGILTILVIYFFGKTVGGRSVGLLSATILAFSPFHVQYSQEVRSYALLAFAASVAMWMTAVLLVDPRTYRQRIGAAAWQAIRHPGAARWKDLQVDAAWLVYMVVTALVVYSHNTAVFLPLAINLFVVGLIIFQRFFSLRGPHFHAPSFSNWVIAQFGALLFWLPWLPSFVIQMRGVADDFWIQPPTTATVVGAIKVFLMAFVPNRIQWQWMIWTFFLVLLAFSVFYYRPKFTRFIFLAVLLITPIAGELLVSLRRPIFYDKTLIWSTIPLYVLIASGIRQLRFRPYILAVTLIYATLCLVSLQNYYLYYEKERWDMAAQYVSDRVKSGDILIFNAGWTEIPFDYYFTQPSPPIAEYGAPETMFERGELEPKMTVDDLPRLKKILQGKRRVWLIYSHNWWTDPNSLVARTLSQKFKLAGMKKYTGMQIYLYVAR
jgi:uncharacterized membrane protein